MIFSKETEKSKMKLKRTLAAAAAALTLCAALAGCGNKEDKSAETTIITEADTSAADGSGESTDILEDTQTWATVTDVENEADRAIYKAQITDIPEGWSLVENSDMGKAYASPMATLFIQATNFGADAELRTLPEFADSVAASIKMTNMFQQADTEFGEPSEVTVAGLPAIKYEYVVTSYIFDFDENGQIISDSKKVYAEFIDHLYVLYNGTDAYALRFETPKENIENAKADFDKMLNSFVISEDGQKGYEEASAFMSEHSISPSAGNAAQ